MLEPWSVLEAVAAGGNLAYTVLMLYERRVGWIFGIAASGLGIALFMHQHVYAQVLLSAYYVGMGVYGWWFWGRTNGQERPITRRGPRFHAAVLLGGAALALLATWVLDQLPGAQYTGLDGPATAFSLLATWMLARKLLENWAYWILADTVAIALYVLIGMYWYAALYAIYVAISAVALVRWHREWRAAHSP